MSHAFTQSLSLVLAMVAFIATCWWAYTPANRKRFEQDANLVLETDPIWNPNLDQAASTHMASDTPALSEKP